MDRLMSELESGNPEILTELAELLDVDPKMLQQMAPEELQQWLNQKFKDPSAMAQLQQLMGSQGISDSRLVDGVDSRGDALNISKGQQLAPGWGAGKTPGAERDHILPIKQQITGNADGQEIPDATPVEPLAKDAKVEQGQQNLAEFKLQPVVVPQAQVNPAAPNAAQGVSPTVNPLAAEPLGSMSDGLAMPVADAAKQLANSELILVEGKEPQVQLKAQDTLLFTGINGEGHKDIQALSQHSRTEMPQLQLSLRQGMEQSQNMHDMIQRFAPMMKQQLVTMVSQGIQQAEIRLDPPELGQMMVRIQVQGQETQVQFHVTQSQTRDVMEQALPRLREMLAEQGMQLTDGQVSQGGGGRDFGSREGSGGASQESMDEKAAEETLLSVNQTTSYGSGIDYYA
ncbi:flagellar hook-length control protein FliK [Shewanella cyperi]|uniref:Flagellar hook-length control protein FliK n=2 Tax=Shewanella cyperi TaxID=2814292 RepID=A0A975AMX0_9GAMM|nr:flagellar hook-length control protein FliK [Shewanella cyperi]QSX42655.1 flagellar hook-length control protein FliK [Shewanella cyperi]